MVDRSFQSEAGDSDRVRLPSPSFIFSQQLEQQLVSIKIMETLDLVLKRQSNLEKRTLELGREIEGLRRPLGTGVRQEQTVANSKLLIDILMNSSSSFTYHLELANTLITPLCKGKYFDLKVRLVGSEVQSTENIPIEVFAYSSDCPPQNITHNMTGGPMIRGERQMVLQHDPALRFCEAEFKIQLNEVTSHFRNGWIFLIVKAGECPLATKIKPLILENVIIKAKESTCQRWRSRCRDY